MVFTENLSPDLEDWLRNTISGLVEYPDRIEIVKSIDEQGLLFTVKVASEDMGKLIGRKGVIAISLRTLLRYAGNMVDARASMKIVEPDTEL